MREDTQVQMHKNEAQYKGNDPADFVWKSYHQWLSLDFVEISTCPWHETNVIYIDTYRTNCIQI